MMTMSLECRPITPCPLGIISQMIERERECGCGWVSLRERERERERVCLSEREREGERVRLIINGLKIVMQKS